MMIILPGGMLYIPFFPRLNGKQIADNEMKSRYLIQFDECNRKQMEKSFWNGATACNKRRQTI